MCYSHDDDYRRRSSLALPRSGRRRGLRRPADTSGLADSAVPISARRDHEMARHSRTVKRVLQRRRRWRAMRGDMRHFDGICHDYAIRAVSAFRGSFASRVSPSRQAAPG